MRLCVLQSAFATPVDNLRYDPARFVPEHVCEHHFIHRHGAHEQIAALARRADIDVFVNLCDGAADEDQAGIEVVHALEHLGVPFTGAGSGFYEPTRAAMKHAARACGIHTPREVVADRLDAAERADRTLPYPLLVKHPNSYASIGMTRASRVTNLDQLRSEVARFLDSFGGALIEEFIDGPEFTVLVAEDPDAPERPVAFVPTRLHFPPGETFKHFDLKFVDYHGMSWTPVAEPALAERLQDMSRRFFVALGGNSYGRCDIRMDPQGNLHMLEINPNCGMFYPPEEPGSADVILQHDPRGHRGFLDLILASALRRGRQAAGRALQAG